MQVGDRVRYIGKAPTFQNRTGVIVTYTPDKTEYFVEFDSAPSSWSYANNLELSDPWPDGTWKPIAGGVVCYGENDYVLYAHDNGYYSCDRRGSTNTTRYKTVNLTAAKLAAWAEYKRRMAPTPTQAIKDDFLRGVHDERACTRAIVTSMLNVYPEEQHEPLKWLLRNILKE